MTSEKLRQLVKSESKGAWWLTDIATDDAGWKVRLLACFAKCPCGECRLGASGESFSCKCGVTTKVQLHRTIVAMPADRVFAVDRLENFFTELARRDPSTLPETVEVEYP